MVDVAMRIASGGAGVAIVLVVWLSALRTVFVPRESSSRTARAVVAGTARAVHGVALVLPEQRRERALDMIGPVSLMLILASWLGGAALGFELLALGFGADPLFLVRGAGSDALLAWVAWLSIVLLAVVFVLHLLRVTEAYGRRERVPSAMAARAAAPPDAEVVVADYLRSGSREQLDAMFAEWSGWLADIRCSHVNYPALPHFRPAGRMCWLKTAVIVLDAAALVQAVAPNWAPPHTRVLLGTGSHCLQDLAERVGLRLPRPAISLQGREESDFGESVRYAVSAGLPAERGVREAWRVFQSARTCYAPFSSAIAARLLYEVTPFDAAVPEPELPELVA